MRQRSILHPEKNTPQQSKHTKNVLANLALEGIYPSAESLADMQLYDEGKLSIEAFLAKAIARAKR